MDGLVLTFGDVFSIGITDYVFLAAPPDLPIIYAAKILTTEESRMLEQIHARAEQKPSYDPRSPVFCFVQLETEKYEQRIAHLRDPELKKPNQPHERLDDEDLRKLLQEIKDGAVPKLLKELVEPISI